MSIRIARLAVLGWLVAATPALAQPTTPEARTREVLDRFFAGSYDSIYEQFSPEMKKALTLERYKAQAAQIRALGKVSSIGEPVVRPSGQFTVVTVPVVWPVVALDFGVSWDQQGQIAGTWFRPSAPVWQRPSYSKPDSFEEREVSLGDEWKLPGTLTMPNGDGPFPALVLVHGSGPNDRDESVGGAKVFKDLAEGLATRGIAVLRYEKRTRVYRPKIAGDKSFTMTKETVDDAVIAAQFLEKQPSLDARRVFVLGHSQGGYMAPRIIARLPRLAGFIVFAGNVRPLEELIVGQTEYINSLRGEVTPEDQKRLEETRLELDKIRQLEAGKENPPTILGLPSSYFLDLKDYNPAAESKKLSVPLLILQGERDYQVGMKDFALWKSALESRKNVTFKSYPKLNHLFVAGEGKSSPAEYQRPGHVSEEVIDDLAKWIAAGRRQ